MAKLEREIMAILSKQEKVGSGELAALPEARTTSLPVLQQRLHWLKAADRENILGAHYLSRRTGREIVQRQYYVDPPVPNTAKFSLDVSILPLALRLRAPPLTQEQELEELLEQKKLLQKILQQECAASSDPDLVACDMDADSSEEKTAGSTTNVDSESVPKPDSESSPKPDSEIGEVMPGNIVVQRFTNPQGES
jgi:hypothetical protein